MNVVEVEPSDDIYIYTLAAGIKWDARAITYSFPTSPGQFTGYAADGEPSNNFEAFNPQQQDAVRAALAQVSSFTNLTFNETPDAPATAILRFGMSDEPETAWGYYPGTTGPDGDAWFNNSTGWYDAPVRGNYAWVSVMHEIGHTLGLDHPHESTPAMPADRDSLDNTVMSYRSYIDAPLDGYTNEDWSFPQTYMPLDVETLQYLYGANYGFNAGDTVYQWSPTTGEMFVNGVGEGAPGENRIFMTVWDGGGNDTYDFSNYPSTATVDFRGIHVSLEPGMWSTLLAAQVASVPGHGMPGSIANAWLSAGDTRSLIENVVGTALDDTIEGNAAANHLEGGAGFDNISGAGGNDTIDGGDTADLLYGGDGDDTVYGGPGQDLVSGDAGNDILDGGDGDDDIRGGEGDNHLYGGAGDDSLEGGTGNDVLDGGSGADRMVGGAGDDTYYVDTWIDPIVMADGSYFFFSGIDSVSEAVGQGNDRIVTSVSLSLPSTIEIETLETNDAEGTSPINLAGNGIANTIIGNGGANRLDGKGGDDRLFGGDGNDILYSGAGNDSLHGDGGDDGLFFGAELNSADAADGGAGFDQVGLQGDYSAGLRLQATSLVSIEQLVLVSGSDARFGDNAGNLYSYDLATDDTNVAPGQMLYVSWNNLRAGENVTFDGMAESDGGFITYAGHGNDTITGGQQNDGFYFGYGMWGAGDNVAGQAGALDQLGLQGDYSASGSGRIVFGAGQLSGVEMIVCISGGDSRFGAPAGQVYHYDLTTNDGNVAAGQTLYVSANALMAANGTTVPSDETLAFDGSAERDGNFVVFSGAGSDHLAGGAGDDTFYGGGGADVMAGGAGNDTFAYIDAAHSMLGAIDQILDFATGDRIDLSRIDAIGGGSDDTFAFIGAAAFDRAAGELRAYQPSAGHWQVEADLDGDGMADLAIALASDHALTAADFVL